MGAIPGWMGCQRLIDLVGPARARELVLTGVAISADHAEQWGIVNATVEPSMLESHVRGVCERAGEYAAEAECYSVKANGILSTIVRDSALLHDLGKLEERNQSVLREQSRRRRHLPVDHTDAGSAALQKMGRGGPDPSDVAAEAVLKVLGSRA